MTNEKAPADQGEGSVQNRQNQTTESSMFHTTTDIQATFERAQHRMAAYLEQHGDELRAAKPSWAEDISIDAVDFQDEVDVWYGAERGVASIAVVVEHTPKGFTNPSELARPSLQIHWEDSGDKPVVETLAEVRSIIADLTAITTILEGLEP
ncbi:hypothetical protein [Microbacterium arborescens]|uniref:hypothetical protein n=1 Tax=Microbacterium arborescens TaxID=33883 RepID=UPI002789CB65|nr:hypothetical protein [Microbacterium arborescens]MDQ1217186.1 hypothetical protein [Microbacterium arborescens]